MSEFTPKGKPASESVQRRLRALLNQYGDIEAAKLLGVARLTAARLASGLPVWPATADYVATRLAELQRPDGASQCEAQQTDKGVNATMPQDASTVQG